MSFGDVQGLRIDHIDGLFDPAGYCAALRQEAGEALYITVEKILAHYEQLPLAEVAALRKAVVDKISTETLQAGN